MRKRLWAIPGGDGHSGVTGHHMRVPMALIDCGCVTRRLTDHWQSAESEFAPGDQSLL